MKSSLSSFAFFATFVSLLANTQAVSNSTDGPSCGVTKADDSYFSVVGVQGTGVHPRQELRELEKDTETWNLFLQAFARFQAMDQDEKVSYYKVAGMLIQTPLPHIPDQSRNSWRPIWEVGWCGRCEGPRDDGLLPPRKQYVWALAQALSCSV